MSDKQLVVQESEVIEGEYSVFYKYQIAPNIISESRETYDLRSIITILMDRLGSDSISISPREIDEVMIFKSPAVVSISDTSGYKLMSKRRR